MIEAFVNKPEKTSWYQNTFNKYQVNGIDKMTWNWSWWAFFGGVFFLLYRKAYLPALGLFGATVVLGWIPFVSLILWILTGGLASYFVYKTYSQKKQEIEGTIEDSQKRIETMQQVGGYNSWVVWLGIILNTLLGIFIVTAVAAAAIA